MIPYTTRDASENDLKYIYSAWLKSCRDALPIECPNEIFFKEHSAIIDHILASSKTIMAVNPDDTSHIYGFITYSIEPNILHFIYVKNAFRRFGIAKRLLEITKPHHYSHLTYAVRYIKKYCSGQFNPYLVMEHYGK